MQKQNMSNYLKFKTMWKAEVVVSQGKGTPGKEYLSCLGNNDRRSTTNFWNWSQKIIRVE